MLSRNRIKRPHCTRCYCSPNKLIEVAEESPEALLARLYWQGSIGKALLERIENVTQYKVGKLVRFIFQNIVCDGQYTKSLGRSKIARKTKRTSSIIL